MSERREYVQDGMYCADEPDGSVAWRLSMEMIEACIATAERDVARRTAELAEWRRKRQIIRAAARGGGA